MSISKESKKEYIKRKGKIESIKKPESAYKKMWEKLREYMDEQTEQNDVAYYVNVKMNKLEKKYNK